MENIQYLVNKYKGDESGKVLFRESSDVADAGACVERHENY